MASPQGCCLQKDSDHRLPFCPAGGSRLVLTVGIPEAQGCSHSALATQPVVDFERNQALRKCLLNEDLY